MLIGLVFGILIKPCSFQVLNIRVTTVENMLVGLVFNTSKSAASAFEYYTLFFNKNQ